MTDPSSISTPAEDTGSNRTKNILVAGAMVLVGCFLIGSVGLYNPEESTGSDTAIRLLGWALIFGSAFVVRHLRWWLLLYLPVIWIVASVLSIVFGVGSSILQPLSQSGGACAGINQYWEVIEENSENHDARLAYTQLNADILTPLQWQTYIVAINTDIRNLRSVEPPDAAEEFHSQFILLLEAWSDVFTAWQRGTFQDQMLFDLQAQDDELEDLQRELVAECS